MRIGQLGGKQPSEFAPIEDFDGFEFVFDQGCFARIVFKRHEQRMTAHPFRYSLTLHAADGTRLLGFDNAHPAQRLGLAHHRHLIDVARAALGEQALAVHNS